MISGALESVLPVCSRCTKITLSEGMLTLTYDLPEAATVTAWVYPEYTPEPADQVYYTAVNAASQTTLFRREGATAPQQLTTWGSESDAILSPDGLHLAFLSKHEGNPELYVMNADGTDVQRLTETPFSESTPAWSPDGTRLVYAANPNDQWDVYILTLATGETRQLTNSPIPDRRPSWSPDGAFIAFGTDSAQDGNVYRIAAEGGAAEALTTVGNNGRPIYAPDGTTITFWSRRDENGTDKNGVFMAEGYLMSAIGEDQRRVTHSIMNDFIVLWLPVRAGGPASRLLRVQTDNDTYRAHLVMAATLTDIPHLVVIPEVEGWALRTIDSWR